MIFGNTYQFILYSSHRKKLFDPVIREWIAGFFLSTELYFFLHAPHPFRSKWRVSIQVKLCFLLLWIRQQCDWIIYRSRGPPSDFDFANLQKIGIGGLYL